MIGCVYIAAVDFAVIVQPVCKIAVIVCLYRNLLVISPAGVLSFYKPPVCRLCAGAPETVSLSVNIAVRSVDSETVIAAAVLGGL